MKKAFKTWYNYLLILLIDGIITLIAVLPHFVDPNGWPKTYIAYTYLFSAVVVIGIFFIVQDIYRAVIRHKINDWENKLEQKYLDKAWAIFFSPLFAGLLSLLTGLILYLFVK